MKINKNITMLTIALEGERAMHPVLLRDDENLVLIDTGYPRHTSQIAEAIAATGQPLTHIILTHQDIDHVGAVTRLMALFPDVKVLAHEDEAKYMDGTATPVKLAAALARYEGSTSGEKLEIDKYAERFSEIRFKVDQTLRDGEVLPIAGGIEVVHTPGHTPGHMCLYLRGSRLMVLGDSAGVADGGTLTDFNPIYIQDIELARKSIQKIMTHPIAGFLGHHSGYTPIS